MLRDVSERSGVSSSDENSKNKKNRNASFPTHPHMPPRSIRSCVRLHRLLGGASAVALLAANIIASSAVWADGGNGGANGTTPGSTPGGPGGVDGALEEAIGKVGLFNPSSSVGSGGGGGAVDLTTGFGAHGGARGGGGIGPGVGAVFGNPGATGAAGAFISTATTINGVITGGAGGAGQTAVNNVNTSGGGGGGGVGISSTADVVVGSSGRVTGGAGNMTPNAGSGGGGVGVFSSANVMVVTGGQVTGGAGGGHAVNGFAGGGGGMGIVLTSGGTLLNSGTLRGGVGGAGGFTGSGGDGGAGVLLTAGGTVVNAAGGVIVGGTGGNARYNVNTQPLAGRGGAGVSGANVTLVNAGSITGAMSGTATGVGAPPVVQAAAVRFTGGVNSLEIQAGSTIVGNVVAFSAADTLRLGGSTNANFDVSLIGPAAQYQGFGLFEKTGSSTWTLTGTTTAVTPWRLSQGILVVSSDGALGDASGPLTFNGGTLQFGADLTTTRAMAITAAGGSVDTQTHDGLFGGAITGTGGLTKTGTGTLTLTGANTYTGDTTIASGTLQLGNGGTSGSLAGNVVNNGALLLNRSNTLTLNGAISGNGTVSQIGTGTTILTGASTYTGGTTISAGALQLGAGGTSGSIVGQVANNGALVFNRSDVMTFDNTVVGTGAIQQIGSGTTRLNADNAAFAGTTDVRAGTLSVNGLLGGTMTVFGGRLQGIGTVGGTMNEAGGTIAPGNSIGTLTIAGNYTSNGGTLEIETALGGDASPTDRLVVTGNTAGATNVRVLNTGGLGAQTIEGIKIIDVGGASNGVFALQGDYVFQGQQAVIGGAYAYTLQKNGVATPSDGDWYLRSSIVNPSAAPPASSPPPAPLYQPGVPLYEAYGQSLQALNSLPTLQQRVGNRYWNEGAAIAAYVDQPADLRSPVWGRAEGSQTRVTPNSSTTLSSTTIAQWDARAGLDARLYSGENGTLIGGITAHYGAASTGVRSFYGDGRIRTDAYSVGATLTWYGVSGFYVDGQAQTTWFDSNLKSNIVGRNMANGVDAFGYAFSIEAGRRFDVNASWSLTPQTQLSYAAVESDFMDAFGAQVSIGRADRLTGRLGLAVDHQRSWRDPAGQLSRATVYGIANMHYDFLGDSRVAVSGTNFSTGLDQLAVGAGLGGTYNWSNDAYSIYGEALVKTSFRDSYSIGGTAGFRMRW